MSIPPPNDGREWHKILVVHDGEELFSSVGMEIMTGSSIEEITGSHEAQEAALKQGRRLANEAAARVGSHEWVDIFPYLADKAGYDITDLDARPVYAARRNQ